MYRLLLPGGYRIHPVCHVCNWLRDFRHAFRYRVDKALTLNHAFTTPEALSRGGRHLRRCPSLSPGLWLCLETLCLTHEVFDRLRHIRTAFCYRLDITLIFNHATTASEALSRGGEYTRRSARLSPGLQSCPEAVTTSTGGTPCRRRHVIGPGGKQSAKRSRGSNACLCPCL